MMIFLSIILVLVAIGIDQYTKAMARHALADKTMDLGFVKLSLVKNKGAFRGLLKKHPQILVAIQIVGVIFVLVLWLIQLFVKKDKLLMMSLSLLLAGAIGNLIDRIMNKYVTDFFAIKWTKNLYYNLADIFIFIGAILTLIKGNKL